jgi:hypothetical protein
MSLLRDACDRLPALPLPLKLSDAGRFSELKFRETPGV